MTKIENKMLGVSQERQDEILDAARIVLLDTMENGKKKGVNMDIIDEIYAKVPVHSNEERFILGMMTYMALDVVRKAQVNAGVQEAISIIKTHMGGKKVD